MKPENNPSYESFREKHQALDSAMQHARDLSASLETMKADLEKSRARLAEVQAKDAAALSDALVSKKDKTLCVKCGRGLGAEGNYPHCFPCAQTAKHAAETVSLCEAGISGTEMNLETARGEVEAARAAEVSAFEVWLSAEYASESAALLARLEKCFAGVARLDALADIGHGRRWDDHRTEHGGGVLLPRGLSRNVADAIISLFPTFTYSETRKKWNELEAVQREAAEKVAAETWSRMPGGRRPLVTPQNNSMMAPTGSVKVIGGRE